MRHAQPLNPNKPPEAAKEASSRPKTAHQEPQESAKITFEPADSAHIKQIY